MGREIRRVPLDFDWPLNKVWDGFINPHYKKCQTCNGQGQLAARDQLDRIGEIFAWIGYAANLTKHGKDGWHPTLDYIGLQRPIPAELFSLIDGLARAGSAIWNERHRSNDDEMKIEGLLGVGSGDGYRIQLALMRAAGLDETTWGMCPTCHNHDGIAPDAQEAYDAWTSTDPPNGEGWQVWETVSEGSPITPVFPTKEALIEHLVTQGYSVNAATAFVESGWVPSMLIVNNEVFTDINAAEKMEKS